jgi:hypothetical protein
MSDITREHLEKELTDARTQRDLALANYHRCAGAEAQLIALIAKLDEPAPEPPPEPT